MLDLTAVKSSNVSAIGHSEGTMFVQYKSGKTYSYAGVTPEQYQAVLGASSVGRAVISVSQRIAGVPQEG